MTENEAIKELEKFQLQVEHSIAEEERCEYDNLEKALQEDKEFLEAFDMAISALKEIQQYREIGTVEECREAAEKQKLKKPVKDKYNHNCCPNCGWIVSGEGGYGEEFCPHCENCGQAIDENLEGREDGA